MLATLLTSTVAVLLAAKNSAILHCCIVLSVAWKPIGWGIALAIWWLFRPADPWNIRLIVTIAYPFAALYYVIAAGRRTSNEYQRDVLCQHENESVQAQTEKPR